MRTLGEPQERRGVYECGLSERKRKVRRISEMKEKTNTGVQLPGQDEVLVSVKVEVVIGGRGWQLVLRNRRQ